VSRRIRSACGGALALGAVLVALPASSAAAATITVNTTADNPPTSTECSGTAGDCSLRQALDKATSGDTVSVPASTTAYQVNTSPIDIPAGVSIVGGGASSTTITGGGHNQIFTVSTSTSETESISRLTITDGFNNTGSDEGGAIFMTGPFAGTLKLDQVAITHSSGPEWGGAIEGGSNLTITRSRFSDDSVQSSGGGAIDFYGNHLSISDTSFVGDSANFGGGLISEGGSIFALNRVTFSGDSATTVGGGMYAEGSGSLYNLTFTGDQAGFGGGLGVETTTTAINATFAKNSSPAGADVYLNGDTAVFSVQNSIFAQPSGGASCAKVTGGTITDNGNNLEDASTSSCGFTAAKHDVIGKSADLGSLANNGSKVAAAGGPPQTLALSKTSPALHAAAASGCTTVGSVDERTMKRPGLAGSACDIGAFELQVSKPTVSIKTPRNHARYTRGKVVHAKYTCREGKNGPGIRSCKGTVAKGKKINTTKLGKHTFTVTARSKDGLKFTRKVTYTVVKAKSSTAPGFTG
jgi:hypothetical protein